MTSPEGQILAASHSGARRVAVVTLGCARNEVDSEELAGRLAGDGYELVADAEDADAVLVNTCGFIESAKKDSVDAILAATDTGAQVVAVGCMAERYGSELAGALPEAIFSAAEGPLASRLRRSQSWPGMAGASGACIAAVRLTGLIGSSMRRSCGVCGTSGRPVSTSSSRSPMVA